MKLPCDGDFLDWVRRFSVDPSRRPSHFPPEPVIGLASIHRICQSFSGCASLSIGASGTRPWPPREGTALRLPTLSACASVQGIACPCGQPPLQGLLTLLSEDFSPFDHSTCALSAPHPYSAFGGIHLRVEQQCQDALLIGQDPHPTRGPAERPRDFHPMQPLAFPCTIASPSQER